MSKMKKRISLCLANSRVSPATAGCLCGQVLSKMRETGVQNVAAKPVRSARLKKY